MHQAILGNSTTAPGAPLEGVSGPDGDKALTKRMRAAVERLERLAAQIVDKLDLLDGDPDLEPVLGSINSGTPIISQVGWAAGGDVDEREPPEDTEHNLGRSENIDQNHLEHGADDLEYSLGSPNPQASHDQDQWGEPNTGWGGGEAEEQCEDEGAQCDDEGADIGDDEPWLGRGETGLGAAQFSLGTQVHGAVLDGEDFLTPEPHGQGGRMVSDDGRGVYWRAGVGEGAGS